MQIQTFEICLHVNRVAELDRKRISLTSDFPLELTTSPQCPTPQPIPVNGLVSEVAILIHYKLVLFRTPTANIHILYVLHLVDNAH